MLLCIYRKRKFLGLVRISRILWTPIDGFLLGSINLITVPLGCLVSGLVTQPFGRKRSMQVLNIPFFIVWLMFHYAESVEMLYASLALTGLAGGLLEAPVSWNRNINLFFYSIINLHGLGFYRFKLR